MRVLFYVNSFPVLSETFILDQAITLTEQNADLTILTNRINSPQLMHQRYYASGIETSIITLDVLTKSNRPQAYDIVHAHFGPAGFVASMLRSNGVISGALVTSFYGYDVSRYPNTNGHEQYDVLFRSVEAVVATTASMAEAISSLGCSMAKIHVHYPAGVDTDSFHPIPEPKSSNTTRIISVCRLVEKKGIDDAIRAIALLAEFRKDITYTIVGDGPLRQTLESLAQSYGLGRTVKFLGAKDDVEICRLLREADLFLLPSKYAPNGDEDSSPIAVIEAQSCGLPVVATTHSGMTDIVHNGVTGLLSIEGNPTLLAHNLERLISDKELRRQMANAARQWVLERFSKQVVAEKSRQLYQQLLSS